MSYALKSLDGGKLNGARIKIEEAVSFHCNSFMLIYLAKQKIIVGS